MTFFECNNSIFFCDCISPPALLLLLSEVTLKIMQFDKCSRKVKSHFESNDAFELLG